MLQELQLADLAPSPTNPRKTFDDAKLEELAASIREKGVLEPLLVRPWPAQFPVRDGQELRPGWVGPAKAKYEVVAGERRYRAAGIAGVETVPCIMTDLSDLEVLEVQTIENLQRDDLHPLEEAEGFAALMKEGSYDVARIAARIGKADGYVYDRLKLLHLIPTLKDVFLAGEISVGHAILLARLTAADQERAFGRQGSRLTGYDGGLFVHDNGEFQPGLDLDDRPRWKTVSIRELQKWINDHVRFDPTKEDLPNLFPETAVALDAAVEEELKVIKITRDHQLRPETRGEGERTYSRRSWKRADGEPDQESWMSKKAPPSKTCEHSVMGVVVAGPGRGDAFLVCVAKKKCKVHWKEEQKAANERGAPNGARTTSEPRETWQKRYEEERQKASAERARWKKAGPALLEALAEKIREASLTDLADLVLEELRPYGTAKNPSHMPRGESAEDAVRLGAFFVLSECITNEYRAAGAKLLKKYGIDAKKIVDEVSPKPKAEKKAKTKKAAEKKPGARARRRTKAGAAEEVTHG